MPRDTLMPARPPYLRYLLPHALACPRPDGAYAAHGAAENADCAALVRSDRPGRHRARGAVLVRVRAAVRRLPDGDRALGLAQRRDEHALSQRAAARAGTRRVASHLRHRAAYRADGADRRA